MLTYPIYAVLFDFRAPCPQTKILIFQGTLMCYCNYSAISRMLISDTQQV